MRDIDEIISFVRSRNNLSPTIKQLLVSRLEPTPTREELNEAHRVVYGGEDAHRSSG